MPSVLKLDSAAFVSPQNHPILVRSFNRSEENAIKHHYIAHTSLDVVEERVSAKPCDCYLGLLFTMEDVAIYGYVTPLKIRIILAIQLSDSVVKDSEIITIFKALHMAYYSSVSNPFLKLANHGDATREQATMIGVGSPKWKGFRRRVDDVNRQWTKLFKNRVSVGSGIGRYKNRLRE